MSTLRKFRDARNWKQFHTPDALAKSIAIEAGELLECFQWPGQDFCNDEALLELADILTYAYFLADRLGADPEEIILRKLERTAKKYPVKATPREDKE